MSTMRSSIVFAVLAWVGLASAAPSKKALEWVLSSVGTDASAVRFGFDRFGVHPAPASWQEADGDVGDLAELVDPTIATAADGKAAWVAAHVRRAVQCAGLTGTVVQCEDPSSPAVEVTLLLEPSGKDWRPVAVHSALAIRDGDVAKAVAGGAKLATIPRSVGVDAEDAVKRFEGSIGDPKTFASTVSDRKDAVLTGSALGEKTVGGAKVRGRLASWKLAFAVHDGIAAGTTASKTVAWVAANLDARPDGKPDAKPTPYRALMIYEQKAGAWQLVAAQFSFVAAQ
jgi:hypothetical protein